MANGSSSSTYTYNNTNLTAETETTVVPSIITQSDQIALYFADDLEEFVRLTHTDLATELKIPDDIAHNSRDIIIMLYEDISHMLRDGLITGIHLLLSDRNLDVGTNAYYVRYHVRYLIDNPNNAYTPPSPSTRFGGLVAPPPKVWHDSRFALLIDWSPSSKERRRMVCRPEYCFDWLPHEDRFDATNEVCYRKGSLAVDSAKLVGRDELATREHQKELF